MKRIATLTILCSLCAPAVQTVEAELFVVENGKPRDEIVIAETVPRMTKLAAEELRTYVERISGAKLPIVTAPSKDVNVQIYVGKSAHTNRLGLSDERLDHGAFRMFSGESGLVLLGQDRDFSLPEPWAHSRADRKRVLREWDAIAGEKWGNPMLLLHKSFNEKLGLCEYDQRGSLNAVYEHTQRYDVRWTAEIRIPVTGPAPRDAGLSKGLVGAKPSSNLPWFFNVCRQRVHANEEKQLQAFSSTYEPSFHVREKFGELYVK